ncbi:DUF1573 domain-containing protein [Flavobacterium agricola]|uniref:DUF1573 domain-containing protein n=1 Tax=Flavobacterium agricola TaxID=2870839 RepID=A0ABY6M3Q2_9FLAO|nr:DUF1573 domain-containing protein [Flavobacterium agricola]UYW02409.1 DUF1573 domain-containing protein [Flavobacterium agricola]
MKKLLGIVAIIACSASTYAQEIVFKDKDNTVDYGTVTQGVDDGLRTFEFTNTGNKPLIIKHVQSTCGCTVPSKPTEPIMPGKTGKIDVKYNMVPGKIAKTITVETNATNVPDGRVSLRIKGNVVAGK